MSQSIHEFINLTGNALSMKGKRGRSNSLAAASEISTIGSHSPSSSAMVFKSKSRDSNDRSQRGLSSHTSEDECSKGRTPSGSSREELCLESPRSNHKDYRSLSTVLPGVSMQVIHDCTTTFRTRHEKSMHTVLEALEIRSEVRRVPEKWSSKVERVFQQSSKGWTWRDPQSRDGCPQLDELLRILCQGSNSGRNVTSDTPDEEKELTLEGARFLGNSAYLEVLSICGYHMHHFIKNSPRGGPFEVAKLLEFITPVLEFVVPDYHANLVISWWLPMFIELISLLYIASEPVVGPAGDIDGLMLESETTSSKPNVKSESTKPPSTLDQALSYCLSIFLKNTQLAMYLLCGDYLEAVLRDGDERQDSLSRDQTSAIPLCAHTQQQASKNTLVESENHDPLLTDLLSSSTPTSTLGGSVATAFSAVRAKCIAHSNQLNLLLQEARLAKEEASSVALHNAVSAPSPAVLCERMKVKLEGNALVSLAQQHTVLAPILYYVCVSLPAPFRRILYTLPDPPMSVFEKGITHVELEELLGRAPLSASAIPPVQKQAELLGTWGDDTLVGSRGLGLSGSRSNSRSSSRSGSRIGGKRGAEIKKKDEGIFRQVIEGVRPSRKSSMIRLMHGVRTMVSCATLLRDRILVDESGCVVNRQRAERISGVFYALHSSLSYQREWVPAFSIPETLLVWRSFMQLQSDFVVALAALLRRSATTFEEEERAGGATLCASGRRRWIRRRVVARDALVELVEEFTVHARYTIHGILQLQSLEYDFNSSLYDLW